MYRLTSNNAICLDLPIAESNDTCHGKDHGMREEEVMDIRQNTSIDPTPARLHSPP